MSAPSVAADALQLIPVAQVVVSSTAAQKARRARFNKDAIAELTESVKAHGVLQPIIVRHRPAENVGGIKVGEHYELVAGERRIIAAGKAGLDEIPAVVRTLTDAQVIEIQLIENLQRDDVHPMEEAEGYHELLQCGHALEELHARIGRSRTYVYSRLKLLELGQKARQAFYGGRISASVAELLARIPQAGKLQDQALERFAASDHRAAVPYRAARDLVHRDYMLRLRGAPFDQKAADLIPSAGPCGRCTFRTGNQPELFGDVKRADVCTDPTCFKAKTAAAAKVRIVQASAAGIEVITGPQAKRVAKWGVDSSLDGYVRADKTNYMDPKADRGATCRTNKKIVGDEAKPALLADPDSGRLIEVYPRKLVDAIINRGRRKAGTVSPSTDAERKRRTEIKFRRALYDQLRPGLPDPTPREVAELVTRRLWSDAQKIVCAVRGLEVKKARYGGQDFEGTLFAHLKALPDAELGGYLNDCIYVRELIVGSYSNEPASRLLAEAKRQGVDAAALKRSLAPKKKQKKKATKSATRKPPKRPAKTTRQGAT